ncbi:MAG TPA: DUF2093 domain-containing protein [Micropepsaceae bacterium]|nr:DUF2093 domain-containing protein [Micropepsaceae bacterium]
MVFERPARYTPPMNQFERDIGGRPAALQYLDGEYRVITPGTYVVCAVTGTRIPLEALRYWSVDLQEAYAGPAAALKRLQEKGLTNR